MRILPFSSPPTLPYEMEQLSSYLLYHNRCEVIRCLGSESQRTGSRRHLIYHFLVIISNSTDCHPNSNPSTPVCVAKPWSRTVRSIACSDCETQFHADCIGMNTAVYTPLAKMDMNWGCGNCGIPHLNPTTFRNTGDRTALNQLQTIS